MLSGLINTAEPTNVPVKAIINEGGTQMRAGLDLNTVAEYTEALTNGAQFPPIILFHDGESYWLADGFHRFAAWKRAFGMPGAPSEYSRPEIAAEVRAGNRRDAILFAAGANAQHGLRRTNADKRRSVEVLLRDQEWAAWSDGEISRRCMVSDRFVASLRKELSPNASEIAVRTVNRAGQTYQQNTANIGASLPAARPLPPAGPITRPSAPPTAPANDLHAGAGRTPPPALTLDELVEDLGGYLAKESAADIQAAANGARNKVLETCLFVLQDMTYRTGDLYRALGRLALQRGAAVAAPQPVAPAVEPAVPVDDEWHDVTAEFHADYKTSGWLICRRGDQQFYRAEHHVIGLIQDRDITFLTTQMFYRTKQAGLWVMAPAIPVAPDSPPLLEWVSSDNNALSSDDSARLSAQPKTTPAREPDPWVAAFDHVGSKQSRIDLIARTIQPWIREYRDKKGRTWQDLVEDGNPAHTNSIFWQDIIKEALRRGATVHEPTLKAAIKQAFSWLAAEPASHPRHDDLFELLNIFRLTTKSLHEWVAITGENTVILDAEHGLRRLSERTNKILEEYR